MRALRHALFSSLLRGRRHPYPTRPSAPRPACCPARPRADLPEMRCLLLLLAALVTGVSGQQCYSSSTCRTCLSDPQCYYYVSCGYCTNFNGGICDNQSPTNNAALCPVDPTAVDAARPLSTPYWTLSIAFVAAGALVALSYSPLERFCGQRLVAGSAHRGFGCNSYLLLFACWCLWFGFSLSLSAPALPWLVSATFSSTVAATAFNIYQCFKSRNGESSYCYIFRTNDGVCEREPSWIFQS